jgi:hypothetical protein
MLEHGGVGSPGYLNARSSGAHDGTSMCVIQQCPPTHREGRSVRCVRAAKARAAAHCVLFAWSGLSWAMGRG